MAQTATSRAVIFATVGFSVGILYSVKQERDAGKRRKLPSPAVAFLDTNRITGRWFQVAAIDTSYFQRHSSNAVLQVAQRPLPPIAGAPATLTGSGAVASAAGSGDGSNRSHSAGSDRSASVSASASGTSEPHFVPPSQSHLRLQPALYTRRTEVLGGAFFGGKELVTDAVLVRPDPRKQAQFVHNAVSGMEKAGVPLWIIRVGGTAPSELPATAAAADADDRADTDAHAHRLFGYMMTCDGHLRNNARIYSREPRMDDRQLRDLISDLEARGFKTDTLVHTAHEPSQ